MALQKLRGQVTEIDGRDRADLLSDQIDPDPRSVWLARFRCDGGAAFGEYDEDVAPTFDGHRASLKFRIPRRDRDRVPIENRQYRDQTGGRPEEQSVGMEFWAPS